VGRLAGLHSACLNLVSEASGVPAAGLAAAAEVARGRGVIGNATCRKLARIDAAFAIVRHATAAKFDAFLCELRGSSKRAAAAAGAAPLRARPPRGPQASGWTARQGLPTRRSCISAATPRACQQSRACTRARGSPRLAARPAMRSGTQATSMRTRTITSASPRSWQPRWLAFRRRALLSYSPPTALQAIRQTRLLAASTSSASSARWKRIAHFSFMLTLLVVLWRRRRAGTSSSSSFTTGSLAQRGYTAFVHTQISRVIVASGIHVGTMSFGEMEGYASNYGIAYMLQQRVADDPYYHQDWEDTVEPTPIISGGIQQPPCQLHECIPEVMTAIQACIHDAGSATLFSASSTVDAPAETIARGKYDLGQFGPLGENSAFLVQAKLGYSGESSALDAEAVDSIHPAANGGDPSASSVHRLPDAFADGQELKAATPTKPGKRRRKRRSAGQAEGDGGAPARLESPAAPALAVSPADILAQVSACVPELLHTLRSLASAQHGSCEVFDHACEGLHRLGMLQYLQLRSDCMVRLLEHPSDAEQQA